MHGRGDLGKEEIKNLNEGWARYARGGRKKFGCTGKKGEVTKEERTNTAQTRE
jgi:hypothetical protein